MYVSTIWYCDDCKVKYEIYCNYQLEEKLNVLKNEHNGHCYSHTSDYFDCCSGGYDPELDNGIYGEIKNRINDYTELEKLPHEDLLERIELEEEYEREYGF